MEKIVVVATDFNWPGDSPYHFREIKELDELFKKGFQVRSITPIVASNQSTIHTAQFVVHLIQ